MAGTAILYNNLNLFSGEGAVGPCPFFTQTQEMLFFGNRWAQVTNATLIGQITGKCSGDFNDLINKQNRLISGFGTDFKQLQVFQNGIGLYDKNYSVIRGINFDQSRYVNLLNYQIDITVYDPELFSGQFGVNLPNETFQFSENEDGIVEVIHEISATAFNTSNAAILNARDWVFARTGWNNQINPLLIQKCYTGAWNFCPQEIRETFNRFTSEYKVTERYIGDIYNSGIGILRYVADVQSGIEEGTVTVSLQGELDYCTNGSLSGLRDRYKSLNLYSLAVNAYKDATNLINLNPFYLSSGVEEDQTDLTLSFNVSFDNNPAPLVNVDYDVQINTDELTSITDVQLSARIFSRGDVKTRYTRVLNYYENNFFPYYLANTQYLAAGYSGILNSEPVSISVTKRERIGEIEYSATWTDKKQVPSGLKDLTYTISIEPPVRQFSENPSLYCNGTYYVYDLGFVNRERININGQATVSKDNSIESGVVIVNNYIQSLKNLYSPGNWDSNKVIMDSNQLTTGDPANKTISFDVGWSRESTEVVF